MNGLNSQFYWSGGATARGEYLAVTCVWGLGRSPQVEFHLFRFYEQALHLVDRQVMPVGDWMQSEPLTLEQLHDNSFRLAEACMVYDLLLTPLAAWPRLAEISEAQFVSRLMTSSIASSFLKLVAGSRCDAMHSFRERLLATLSHDPEFRSARGDT
jgi:hypothetical protein